MKKLLLAISFIPFLAYNQTNNLDMIVFIKGDTLFGNIVEVGVKEIIFKTENNTVKNIAKKTQIQSIVYKSGKKQTFKTSKIKRQKEYKERGFKRMYIGIGLGSSSPTAQWGDYIKTGLSAKIVDISFKINNIISLTYSWWGNMQLVENDEPIYSNGGVTETLTGDYWGIPTHTFSPKIYLNNKKNKKLKIATKIGAAFAIINSPQYVYTLSQPGFDDYEAITPSELINRKYGFTFATCAEYHINDFLVANTSIDYFNFNINDARVSFLNMTIGGGIKF